MAGEMMSVPPGPPGKLAQLHPRHFFLDTWRQMDREAALEREQRAESGKGYDFRPLVALLLGAVCLSLMEYFGGSRALYDLLEKLRNGSEPDSLWHTLPNSPFFGLVRYVWWSGWRVLGYMAIPIVAIWIMRGRVRDHGLATKGFWEHAWIYGLAYLVVLVCVVVVSFSGEFSSYYPFYKQSSRSWFDFISWELLYAAQFFALEFFFRGYWLKALKPMMGSHAIFAMVVPYCMIHFGKPFVETLGAVIAGVVLGTLAMKTRSIWSGFLIHVSVAVSMDVASLLQGPGLPQVWWPTFS